MEDYLDHTKRRHARRKPAPVTDETPSLFDPPEVSLRVGRSPRQDQAQEKAEPHAPNARERIVCFLRDNYRTGITRPVLAGALGMSVNTVNARVSELRDPKWWPEHYGPPVIEDGTDAHGRAYLYAVHGHPVRAHDCGDTARFRRESE